MRINPRKKPPVWEKWVCFAGSFLFFAFIMWCAPYSSDDIEFSLLQYDSLSGYLDYALRYGNGRLLGNLCAILLCHSKLLCVLGKAGVLASCVVMIPRLLGQADRLGYTLSFLLFTLIEPAVFGEVYVWTSGFSNYLPPIWLSLIILCVLNAKKCPLPMDIFRCILVLLLGVCSQLFIEHSSGVNLLLALAFAWDAWRRKKESRFAGLCWVLGTLAGLVLMLAIPRLFYTAGNRVETYRSLNLSSLSRLILSVAKNTIQLCGHYFGACLLTVSLGGLSCIWQTRHRWSPRVLRLLTGMSLGSLAYLVLSMALSTTTYRGKSALIEHTLECVVVAAALASWCVAAWRLEKPLRCRVLGCLGFAVVSVAPLLLVTPIPTRVIYQSYFFVLLGTMLSCSPVLSALPGKWLARVKKGLLPLCLGIVLIISSVFASVHFMVQLRDRHIRQAIAQGETAIEVFQVPYSYTSWDHLWSQGLYYQTLSDEELSFTTIDFDSWMHQYWTLE